MISFTDKRNPPLPANLNDADITPTMTNLPPEHDRPSEMIFCLMRFEVGRFLYEHGCRLHDPSTPVPEKDDLIRLLEDRLTEKYLSKCDPAIPLHKLAIGGSRAGLCKLKVMAHHPAQYPDKGKSLPQSEHDALFSNAVEMSSIHLTGYVDKGVEIFLWHVDVYFHVDALVFMLIESRTQPPTAPLTEKAWGVVQAVLTYRSELMEDDGDELHSSVRQLVAQTWAAREAAARRQGLGPLQKPPMIARVQEMVARSQLGHEHGQPSEPTVLDRPAHPMEGSDGPSSGNTAVVTPDDGTALFAEMGPDAFQYQAGHEPLLRPDVMDWDSWDYWEDLLQGNKTMY